MTTHASRLAIPPSDFVKQHAKQVVKEIGDDFVIIHVRRGDVITTHEEYWGIKKADMDRITHSVYSYYWIHVNVSYKTCFRRKRTDLCYNQLVAFGQH